MQYDFSHIEQYINEQLPEGERLLFERALKSDPSLQSDVQAYRDMVNFVQTEQPTEHALSQLHEVHEEYLSQNIQEGIPSGKSKKILILIGILMLTAFAFYFLSQTNEPEQPVLEFATLFDPSPMSLTSRGEESQASLIAISNLFNEEKYNDVIVEIERSSLELDKMPRLKYVKGICLLATDRVEEAKTLLTNLKLSNPIFKDDVNWYVSLCYLKEGDIDEAVKALRELPDVYLKNKGVSKLIEQLEAKNQ